MDYAREAGSHVNADGSVKRVYPTEELARHGALLRSNQTRRVWTYYRCAQGPEHYHLTKSVPDLRPR